MFIVFVSDNKFKKQPIYENQASCARGQVIMYQSIRNFSIPPPPGRRREFELFKIWLFKFPATWAKNVFKSPTVIQKNYEKLQYKRQEISSHHTRYRYIIMNQVHESGRLYMSRETL